MDIKYHLQWIPFPTMREEKALCVLRSPRKSKCRIMFPSAFPFISSLRSRIIQFNDQELCKRGLHQGSDTDVGYL